ncbi:MAG: XRE family transcriptional regulator [Coriobacteriia bacterium]|nr:XRE family transcriptional regulator [Coriobacteriia bacterium]
MNSYSQTKGFPVAEPLTEELLNNILDAKSLDQVLQDKSFVSRSLADYLQHLLEEKNLRQAQVVRDAQLNATFGYQIFKGTRNCSRDAVLKISFAMGLSVREANRALQAAGHAALYSKDRRDAILIFCLDHGYDLQRTEGELFRLNEPTLTRAE